MSLQDRVEDAKFLWNNGRKEGAWVQMLTAFAATARRRYPKLNYPDSIAFKKFIKDEMVTILYGENPSGVKFQGEIRVGKKQTALEYILYNEIRCQLVHEGELPKNVIFTESKRDNEKVSGTLKVDEPYGIPEHWIFHLEKVIKEAPENRDLFPL
jgi:hypothetical protein